MRVCNDVGIDALPFGFTAEDVLVVITLPYRDTRRIVDLIDLAGCYGFKIL